MTKYCGNCGTKLVDKQKFCGNCGAAVTTDIKVNTTTDDKSNIHKNKNSYTEPNENKRWERVEQPKKTRGFLKIFLIILGVLVISFIGLMYLGSKFNGDDTPISNFDSDKISKSLNTVDFKEAKNDDGTMDLIVSGWDKEDNKLWDMTIDNITSTEISPYSDYIINIYKNIIVEVSGTLYSIHGDTGEVLWEKELKGSGAAIVEDEDGIYYISLYYGDFLQCISPMGKTIWTYTDNESFYWPYEIELKKGQIHVKCNSDDGDEIAVFNLKGDLINDVEDQTGSSTDNDEKDTSSNNGQNNSSNNNNKNSYPLDADKISHNFDLFSIGAADNKDGTADVIMWGEDKDKNKLWELTLDNIPLSEIPVYSSPQISKYNNIIVEVNSILYHIHGDTGEIIWKKELNGSGAYIGEDKNGLYYVSLYYGDFLQCITPMGEVLWIYPETDDLYWPEKVVIIKDKINVTCNEGDKIALFNLNGELIDGNNDESDSSSTVKIIKFKDTGFEKAIRDYYKLGNGDIYWKDIRNKEMLDLSDSKYKNEIKSIEDIVLLENLKKIRITGSKNEKLMINGDLSYLSNLTKLEYISFSATNIGGNLNSLSKLMNLEFLYLADTNVTGDIVNLSNHNKLKALELSYTEVIGDINSLSELTKLKSLYLHHSLVKGDIKGLSTLTELIRLWMYNTAVYGDISSLSGLTNLANIALSRTGVNGDISSFSKLINLEVLAIDNTDVTGNKNVLDKLPKLKEIYIKNTNIN